MQSMRTSITTSCFFPFLLTPHMLRHLVHPAQHLLCLIYRSTQGTASGTRRITAQVRSTSALLSRKAPEADPAILPCPPRDRSSQHPTRVSQAPHAATAVPAPSPSNRRTAGLEGVSQPTHFLRPPWAAFLQQLTLPSAPPGTEHTHFSGQQRQRLIALPVRNFGRPESPLLSSEPLPSQPGRQRRRSSSCAPPAAAGPRLMQP